MLLAYGGRNFYSFKEDFDISLEHKSKPLSILGIKGANASGKTNAVKALSFLRAFISASFSEFKPDDGMLRKAFFDSQENTKLYIHFKTNNIEYKYEIEFTDDKLLKEKLSRKDSRWIIMFSKEEQKVVECIKELDALNKLNLNRTNISIVSLAHQYGLNELNDFYSFAENITTNVNILGRNDNDEYFLGYRDISKYYFKNKDYLNLVGKFLKNADTGIDQITIIEVEDKITKELTYEPFFHHKVGNKTYQLQYFEESTGTQLLYRQLIAYFVALKNGSVVAYDEFDVGLHPDLSLMVIDLFDDKKINSNGAQLILTSHNSEIIDKLGKYRLIFVNKEDNESYLYRLDEISGDLLRPDRSIMPAYNSKQIGGRPKVVKHG